SRLDGSTASFLHVTVADAELDILKRPGSIDLTTTDLVTTPLIADIRRAVVTFVVGAWIRRRQQTDAGEPPDHFSFIVHTHTTRAAHNWQSAVVRELVRQLQEAAANRPDAVRQLVRSAHADLSDSLRAEGL